MLDKNVFRHIIDEDLTVLYFIYFIMLCFGISCFPSPLFSSVRCSNGVTVQKSATFGLCQLLGEWIKPL